MEGFYGTNGIQSIYKTDRRLDYRMRRSNFKLILDEPESLGGNDKGMNPVECLLVALGACKCIVAKAFAQKNRINLQDIRIELEGILDPDGF